MNASEDKMAKELTNALVNEKERERIAREAADVLKQVRAGQERYGAFVAKNGGLRPEDAVLSFGMAQLEGKIIQLS